MTDVDRRTLTYRVPLDSEPGRDAILYLPRDLTSAEAVRLQAFLLSLVNDGGAPPDPSEPLHICELGDDDNECDLAPGVVCLAHYNAAGKPPDLSEKIVTVAETLRDSFPGHSDGWRLSKAHAIVARLFPTQETPS